MIVGGTIEIESRCQNECHLLSLLEAVNFAVDIEEKVTLEGGTGGGNSVHPIERLSVGVEGRDLENILEQRYSGTRHYASAKLLSIFVLPLPISRSISEGNTRHHRSWSIMAEPFASYGRVAARPLIPMR